MKKISCLFLAIVISYYSSAQKDFKKYYHLINKGNDAFDSAKYSNASIYFIRAFKKVKNPFSKDLNRAAIINIKLNQLEIAKKYYRHAALYGFIPADSTLKKISTNDSQPFLSELKNINLTQTNKFNKIFSNIIDSLFKIDQNIRGTQKFTKNGLNIDSLNTLYLLKEIVQFGFPSEINVGVETANKAFIIFLHADFDIENVLLGAFLLKAVRSGEFKPVNYAEIVDRRCNFSGRPFIYYQVPFGYDALPKTEKDKVTAMRYEIGLRSVEKTIQYKFLPDGSLQIWIKE